MDLRCALVGDTRIVSAHLEPTANVEELTQLVHKELGLQCDANLVMLFTITNGVIMQVPGNPRRRSIEGEWCTLDELVDGATAMEAKRRISDYLPSPSRDPAAIHVLVEAPRVDFVSLAPVSLAVNPANHAAATPASADQAPAYESVVLTAGPSAFVDRARECLSFTDVTIERRKQLTAALKLVVHVERVNERSVASKPAVGAFKWSPERDDADERQRLIGYLETHIDSMALRKDMRLEFVSELPALLSVADERLPFDLYGGADAVVVQNLDASTRRCLHHLQGLCLVIDIKRDVDEQYAVYEAQAIAKLIAASLLHSDACIALLLTNLGSVWTLLWLSSERDVKSATMTTPEHGLWMVSHVVSAKASASVFHVPFVGNCKRTKLTKLLAECGKRSASAAAAYGISEDAAPTSKRAKTVNVVA